MASLLVLVAAAAMAMAVARSGEAHRTETFELELDNAFGVEAGSDVRVAGVHAGKVTSTGLDFRTRRALVDFRIDRNDFGSLRADARCEVRLQSPIGDYYLDCRPGSSAHRLTTGARIPVTQSAATIPPDLIQDIQRDPYRERLSIFINELGAAAAGNGKNLNDALRRLVPALRTTDEVLHTLADERSVIARLTTNANRVVSALAHNRRDVGRWVDETRNTTAAAAARKRDLAAGFAKLPGFLRELTPSMGALRSAAEEGTPALVALSRASDRTRAFLEQLGEFSTAGRPAVRALGRAAHVGAPAMRRAGPVVRELGHFGGPTPDVANNLAIILEHLDSRDHAVEKDPQSPGGKGFTGLEAPLQWALDYSLLDNLYTRNGHFSTQFPVVNDACNDYADAEAARKVLDQCASFLGPTQPGVTTADPTASPDGAEKSEAGRVGEGQRRPLAAHPPPPGVQHPPGQRGPELAPPATSIPPLDLGVPGVDPRRPELPLGSPPAEPSSSLSHVLDYLLAP